MRIFVSLVALSLAGPVVAEEISAADLPGRIVSAAPQVAVLGEVHDNADHHLAQAAAVAALKPKALVFEMLDPAQAAKVTPDLIATPDKLAKVLGWEASGWPDFAIYAPIFAAAPTARIYGAALPRDQVRRAMKEPLAQVFPEAARFGLDTPYPADLQARLEAETQADHCNALPVEMLPGMVAAQRLRDAAFAQTTLTALSDTGGPVALITGSGHARADRAVPALIAHADPGVKVLSLGQLERPAAGDQPFDLWIVTDPAPREDPCKAFQ
ncbi:ChaN family lipoprotein [Rhodobacter capsulatus]|uniref:ChaN family lipoprotein n=1 Tax=Rhodobacter capsulatus TaxID=1061 RepID=UPI0040258F8B